MMQIEQQKELAAEILDKLYLISPSCILAGGAPRDWLMGSVANDLDIYFASSAVTSHQLQKQVKSLFGDDMKIIKPPLEWKQNNMYRTMKFLKRILYCEYKGTSVQLIELVSPQDTYKVVKSMSVSICKAWWKNDDVNGTDIDFKITMKSGVMFLSDGYKWSDEHPTKMKERFKGKFVAGNKDHAKDRIVGDSLKGE